MSNLNGLSYTQMINRLQAFANGHKMKPVFQHGLIDLIDVPKDQRYPVMHVLPAQIQPVVGGLNYQFEVVFYDLPRAKEVENEYQRECISDMARLALDLIAEVQNGNVLFGRDVTIDGNPTIEPFIESYSQVTTGVMLSIGINVPYNWNACDIPADYSVGGSGSGGSGSGSGAIVLKVNGTDNAVQNVLNLVNGPNITITDLGDGRVRISATGGGGGGVDWGAIGGDITDQTDLVTLIGGYATDADLTSEATTRANADTALQGDIDAVAADLATETTARLAGDATNATDISNVNNALTSHVNNTSNPHNTTKAQVGLGNVPNVDTTTTSNITDSANKRFVTDAQLVVIGNTSGTNTGDETTASIQTKRPLKTIEGQSLEGSGNIDLTKSDVGLGNVDNTSDLNKPISTATQTALNAKENTITAGTTSQYFRGDKTFQTLDKTAVGLGNVDNTSDANKPVSTAQAAAIALKQDTLVSGTNIKTVNGQSLVGSGNVAVNQSFRTLSTGVTVPLSSGDRFFIMQSGLSSGTESAVTMSAEYAMTITEIRIRTTNAQPASGSLVFTLRRNGADTALVLTLAANAVAGVYTATGSIAIAAGDLICMKIRNNATATSANLVQISISYQ